VWVDVGPQTKPEALKTKQVLDKYDCYFYRNYDALQGIGESCNSAEVRMRVIAAYHTF